MRNIHLHARYGTCHTICGMHVKQTDCNKSFMAFRDIDIERVTCPECKLLIISGKYRNL